ncbi:MAG: hypothetical protein ABJD97_13610 [Betaproteobacteria bacterium]
MAASAGARVLRCACAAWMALANPCVAASVASTPAPVASSVAVMAPGCTAPEMRAVGRVIARVKGERLYASWTTPDCLSYIVDSCAAKAVDVSIHEKHDARCGGDPGTWPRVDSFRVYRSSTRIDWYNVAEDRFRPFSRIHSEGHR